MSSSGASRSTGSLTRQRGRIIGVVRRQVREELAHEREARRVVGRGEVADAALSRVRRGAAELFLAHRFVGDGADHVGTRDEHVARALDHEDEIGDRGRIHGAARARAHHARQLRNDAARERVAEKDVGVARERLDAFLNARATRVVEADHRRADAHRVVHDAHDLLRVSRAERAAEDGEVLREHEHAPPVDRAVSGDDAVARNARVGRRRRFRAAMTSRPVSTNEPVSSRRSRRSRAVSFPAACCLSTRAVPPPAKAARSSSSRRVRGFARSVMASAPSA